MRTTLDIAEDVLIAAKEIARQRRQTAGEVISDLARRALTATAETAGEPDVLGFRPFPRRGGVVTNEVVDRIRQDEDV